MTATAVRDAGVATLPAVAAVAALMLVTAVCAGLGGAISTRHRVEAAADLAALAAAARAPEGATEACADARRVADGMRVRLIDCRLVGWDARVEVGAQAVLPLVAPLDAVARARAGPADR